MRLMSGKLPLLRAIAFRQPEDWQAARVREGERVTNKSPADRAGQVIFSGVYAGFPRGDASRGQIERAL